MDALGLSLTEIIALTGITFFAGVVRGFAGFALSALVMAIGVAILPPIQILPMLWFLEMSASLMMVRGGLKDAKVSATAPLVIGTWIGTPIGLALIVSIDVGVSKQIALAIILVLAALSLGRVRLPHLDTKVGAIITGIVAGIVTGLANVGGMVIALYVLSLGAAARSMRGVLVLYLFASSIGSLFFQLYFGVMDVAGAQRGLIFVVPTLIGVMVGTKLFMPKWEFYYRPFCLSLLVLLALAGLLREVL